MRTPLIYRGLRFFKNHGKGNQDFLVKLGSSPYKEGYVYRRMGKLCFSLRMYGFCGSNAVYSASLSFALFIFLLTPFDLNGYYSD